MAERQVETSIRYVLLVGKIFDILSLLSSGIICFLLLLHVELPFLPFDREQLLLACAVIGGYGTLSVLCNCAATFGINKRSRIFLLPYLVYIPIVISLLIILVITSAVFRVGVTEYLVLNLFAIVISLVLSRVWVKVLKQWNMMAQISIQQDITDLERELASVLAIIISQRRVGDHNVGVDEDSPPLYESLDQQDACHPPCYEDAIKEKFKLDHSSPNGQLSLYLCSVFYFQSS